MRPAMREFVMRGQPPHPKDWCSVGAPQMKKGKTVAEAYIYDEIGYWGTTADAFAKEINALDVDEIILHLNSPGGDIFDGVTIYNTLKNHKAKVTVFVDGLAASAASFIAQAGDEIIMGKATTMMIHDGWGICIGNEADMLETAKVLGQLSDNIASIYAREAGGEQADWRELMRAEVWYTDAEAVAAGLAHRIAGEDDEEETASNSLTGRTFNLKNFVNSEQFKYAGREEAPDPNEIRRSVRAKMALHQNQEKDVPPTPQKNETEQPVVPDGATEQPVTEAPKPDDNPTPSGDPAAEPATQPQPDSADEAGDKAGEGENPQAKAATTVFNLGGGRTTSDPREAQAFIDSMVETQNQQRAAARASFIEGLATDGKLAATAIDGMKALVDTFTDSQYDAWKATWDGVSSSSLFANHGSDKAGTDTGSSAQSGEGTLAYHEEIVARHRISGLTQAQIDKTPSGQFLAAHQAKSS